MEFKDYYAALGVEKGMDAVRAMTTLGELDTEFPRADGGRPLSPRQFWPLFDEGKFK